MDVVKDGADEFVFIVTENGYAKRTPVDQYRVQGRGGLGIKVAKLTEERGDLVGAMIVSETDEALIVMERGKVVRSSVAGVPAKGRDTMGVVFAKPDKNDRIMRWRRTRSPPNSRRTRSSRRKTQRPANSQPNLTRSPKRLRPRRPTRQNQRGRTRLKTLRPRTTPKTSDRLSTPVVTWVTPDSRDGGVTCSRVGVPGVER